MAWQYSIFSLDEPGAKARWRALGETSPERSVFSSLAYAEAVKQALGIRTEMHLISDEDGTDHLGVVAYVRSIGPYRELIVPPYTPHSALIFNAPLRDTDINQQHTSLDALLAALEGRFHRLRFQLPPSLTDVRSFSWRAWQVRPYYTYRAALNGEDAVLDDWSRRTRRTAQNERERFMVEEDPGAASTVVQLYFESLDRQQHMHPASRTDTEAFIQRLYGSGLARLFLIRDRGNGTPVGGMAMLVEGEEAWYWLGGSKPGSAMTVLLGGMLPRLRRDGVRTIDYAGANTPSIAEFKRQFGGTLTPYFGVEKRTRPELRVLDIARALKARMR